MKEYVIQWMNNPANKTKKYIAIAVLVILCLLVVWWIYSSVTDWLHDVNYNTQQTADKTAANKAAVNATQHETNANVASDKQKELEQDEINIKRQQDEQRQRVDKSTKQSKNTRDRLDSTLRQGLPDRSTDAGLSDDQLRADSDAAARTFDPGRTTPTPTPKP